MSSLYSFLTFYPIDKSHVKGMETVLGIRMETVHVKAMVLGWRHSEALFGFISLFQF